MEYEPRTRDLAENRWDMALVTFCFAVSLLVVLILPALAVL